jgi:iron complex outermembrane receptor protein
MTISVSGFCQDIFFPDSIRVFDEVFILAQKNLNETGSKITRIDSLIIENKVLGDLSSLLSENTPVFIKSYGRGSLSTASFRGTNASHTKLTWNNVSLNSPMLGMVDMSQIPLAVADNIILYHGAASLSKNANAIGGLIELNTRPIWEKGIRVKLVSSAGSYSSYDNLIELKAGNTKFQSVTKAYQNFSKNDFKFANTDITNSQIDFRKNADYSKKGISQELFFRPGAKSTASIKAWYQDSDRGVPGLTTNESGLNNNINRQNGNMLIYSAEYLWYGDKSKFEVSQGANIQNLNYNSTNYINGIGYLNVVDSKSKSISIFNTAVHKYKLSDKTEISTRLNYNYHDVNSIEKVRNESYDKRRHEGGLTFSMYSSAINKLRFGILLRQDFYDKQLSPFIPSVFAEYYLSENTILKSSVARNYNLPGLNDLYFSPGGNPLLVPENGYSVDGGIQNQLKKDKFILQSELSINYSNISDWIMWRPTAMGYWTPANIDKVVAYGADINANLKYMISDFYFMNSANYAYTRSENKSATNSINDNSTGKQLPYIPVHSANLFSRIEYKKFYISHQWNFFSERFTTSAAEPGILVSIYPYFMNDLSLGKMFESKKLFFDLNVRVYNIFNESYRSVLWQPMPGRNYSVQLTVRFR